MISELDQYICVGVQLHDDVITSFSLPEFDRMSSSNAINTATKRKIIYPELSQSGTGSNMCLLVINELQTNFSRHANTTHSPRDVPELNC